jgi:hypothetical protein
LLLNAQARIGFCGEVENDFLRFGVYFLRFRGDTVGEAEQFDLCLSFKRIFLLQFEFHLGGASLRNGAAHEASREGGFCDL